MRLETPRTIVRSWREDDIPAYARIVADPEVMRFIGDGAVHTYAQAASFVRSFMRIEQERGWILWAVEDKAMAELMGFCGFGRLDGQIDFGYRFAKKFWGQGLATEVAGAVLEYGMTHYDLGACTAMAFVANIASRRVLEKIGFVFDTHSIRYEQQVAHYRYGGKA